MCYAPFRETKHFVSFLRAVLFYSLATMKSARKHFVSRFSLPTTAVWRTRCPKMAIPLSRGLSFPARNGSCPQVTYIGANLKAGDVFFVSLCATQISTDFLTAGAPLLSRCRPLLKTCGGINLERRSTSRCDESLTSHLHSLVGTNQPKF